MVNNAHQEGNSVRLERYSPLAPMGAAPERISLDALAFMASIPTRYMHLLGRIPDAKGTHLHELRTRDRERQFAENLADLVRLSQHQIDNTMLTLKVRGKDIRISQGELRKIMEERVAELEERRAQLAQNGGSPEERRRIEELLERYKPAVESARQRPADAATTDQVGRLIEDDPAFADKIEERQRSRPDMSQERRTSYAAEMFSADGIAAPTLRASFNQGASSASPTPPLPAAPPQAPSTFEKTAQSFGL